MFVIALIICNLIVFAISYSIFNRFYYKRKILNKLNITMEKIKGKKVAEAKKLTKGVSITLNDGFKNRLKDKLSYIGFQINVNIFINAVLSTLLVIFALSLMGTSNLLFAVAFVTLSLIIINFLLNVLIKKRLKRVSDQLLDMVITLSSSLKSGYSLIQGLSTIAQSDLKPLSIEVELVIKDINIGKSFEDAFEKMIKRNPNEDLQILVTGILINKETGGNLSHILDNISETLRERVRINGEVKSLTAQGRLSGSILSLMPICIGVIVYMMNPAYMSPLFNHPLGKILLIFAGASEILGIAIIKKITKIDW